MPIRLYGVILALMIMSTSMGFVYKTLPRRITIRSVQSKSFLCLSNLVKDEVTNLNKLYVYTRPGCKYCRIAKAMLNEWGLPYNEIDISADTINDSANAELNSLIISRLEYTRSRTVPQIYIGDEHIGGCDDLLDQIKNNTFIDTLKRWNISANKAIITDSSTESAANQSSTNTFSKDQQELPYLNYNENTSKNTSNNFSTLPPPLELSRQLQRTILELSDQFISSDGKKVKYKAMSVSSAFQQYCSLSSTLSLYSITDLAKSLNSNAQRLSFFVNIYNAMIIHATCVLGTPANNPISRSLFFNGTTGAVYNISGYLFSPDDIEHGLIRANTAHPSQAAQGLIHYFNSDNNNSNDNDSRTVLSLSPPLDPRIHFILNCGASSCPPIAVLGSDPEEALVLAARVYLETEVKIDAENRVVYLPKLTLWYGADFGSTLSLRLERIINMLSPSKREDTLVKLAQLGWHTADNSSSINDTDLSFKVEYNAYDWTSNEA